ncbi:MAG: hypothetical protein ABI946_11860, partial [Chthoniobacterales bacterium]
MSKLALKRSRQLSAFTLFAVAAFIALSVGNERSRSANPVMGSLSPTGAAQTWVGTGTGPAGLDES